MRNCAVIIIIIIFIIIIIIIIIIYFYLFIYIKQIFLVRAMRKNVFGHMRRAFAEFDQGLRCPPLGTVESFIGAKARMRLCACAGWCESAHLLRVLAQHTRMHVFA